MRIIHVISSCQAAGAEIFTKNLLKTLKENGSQHDFQLWVMTSSAQFAPGDLAKLKYEESFVKELTEIGIEVKFINKRPKKDWLKTKARIKKLFKETKPNIIHCHLESVTFHVCRSLFKENLKIIQTIHSTYIRYPLLQKLYISKKINRYVAISNQVEEKMIGIAGVNNKKIDLIYNGIDIGKFSVPNRRFNSTIKTIVAIGRLTEAKDHTCLFHAYKLLIEKLLKDNLEVPTLNIVGDGELKDKLKNLAKELEINKYVHFSGIISDIPNLLSSSDIYVMSSEWEGLSISLIEALASGIPIVATDAGSNNEIISNMVNGLIVPVKDPQALSRALYKVIIDEELRKKISIAATKSSINFDIHKSAMKHESLYEKVNQN